MTEQQIKTLLIYRSDHPADDELTCFNRWQAMQSNVISIADIPEALLISKMKPNQILAQEAVKNQ